MMSHIETRGSHGYILFMSITKLFVAIIIHYLVSKKKLKYDDKVKKYFPKYLHDITIMDILEHKTGIYSNWTEEYQVDTKHREYVMNLPIVSEVGKYEYNNYTFDILCEIIEKITKTRIDKYIGQIFFDKYNIKYFWYSKGKSFGGFGLAIPTTEAYKMVCLMEFLKTIEYKHMLSYDMINDYIGHSGSGGQFMYFSKDFDKFIFLANTGSEPYQDEFTKEDLELLIKK